MSAPSFLITALAPTCHFRQTTDQPLQDKADNDVLGVNKKALAVYLTRHFERVDPDYGVTRMRASSRNHLINSDEPGTSR